MDQKLVNQRYRRLQEQLKSLNLGALLLTDPIHIRYATGTSNMPLWTAFNYARYCVIPSEGEPVIWEYPEAQFVAHKYWKNVRPCEYWQYRFSGTSADKQAKIWASQIFEVLRDMGIAKEKIGLDRLDFYAFNALQKLGLNLCDADEPMQKARMIKLPGEIEIMQKTVALTERALKSFKNAIEPGVSENELLAVFWKGILARGGEWCYTRLIAGGQKTNPWFQESSDHKIQKGDLVAIDTDVIGLEGYACDISRTFICSGKPTPRQKDNYKYAKEYLDIIKEQLAPGKSWTDIVEKLPPVAEKFLKQRYPIFAHGLGMDDEPPFYPFPDQSTSAKSEDVLSENMVICVEFYAGEIGGADGVKLEDQLLITSSGSEQMNSNDYEDLFLQ